MSSRFPTSLSRRTDSSQIVSASSSRRAASSPGAPPVSAEAAPVIAASGVRRSCDTAERSELRISSVRARRSARLGVSGQADALERQCALSRQSVQEVPLLGVGGASRHPRHVGHHAQHAAVRRQRDACGASPGKRVRAQARGTAMRVRPARDAQIPRVEHGVAGARRLAQASVRARPRGRPPSRRTHRQHVSPAKRATEPRVGRRSRDPAPARTAPR